MRIKKINGVMFAAALWLCLTLNVNAFDPNEALNSVRSYIPSDLLQYIPSDLFETESVYSIDSGVLLRVSADALRGVIIPALSGFAEIAGIIIIASIFGIMKRTLLSGGLGTVSDMACGLCLTLSLYGVMSVMWEDCFAALENLSLFMNGLLPIMTSLYAAGGEIASAAVSNASMITLLALLENIIRYALYPVLKVCFGLSIAGCVSGLDMSGISSFVRTTYTTVLTFIMGVLTFILASQAKLAQSADGMAVRTVRFAAGSFVPVIGGAVSEAIRTVLGSFAYIKSATGVLGVIVLLLIVLPVIVRMFAMKIALALASSISKLIGCDRESAFIGEAASLLNLTLAVIISLSVMFIFYITLFIKTGMSV